VINKLGDRTSNRANDNLTIKDRRMLNARLALTALLTLASTASAQPGRRARAMDGGDFPSGMPRGGAGSLATALIDARRDLNLTPRQIVALDSIERTAIAERRRTADALTARRDSLCANRRPCALSREERLQLMGGANRIGTNITERLKTDSLRRARILGMLDTTQRRMVDRMRDRRDDVGPGERRMIRRGGMGGVGPRGFRGRGFGPGVRGPRGRMMGPWNDGFGPGRGGRMRPRLDDDEQELDDARADSSQGGRRGPPPPPARRRPGEPGDSIPEIR
jgi:hypothetical protein